ncbi:hypothetical protein [Kribbella ginsengisoli]|uniref:Uncharacterized protein n=1 Tax=Kribbella ginsengisoli TaxID=363865 RepID=A0ABP6ZCS6_9ACTN
MWSSRNARAVRAVRRWLLLATAGAAIATLAPAPATAATTCSLDIIRNPSNFTLNNIRVDCVFGEIGMEFTSFTLYGSDTWYNDTLFSVGRFVDSPTTGPTRIEDRDVNGFHLDEDWGKDEVFAKARVVRSNGQVLSITTNMIVREFSY